MVLSVEILLVDYYSIEINTWSSLSTEAKCLLVLLHSTDFCRDGSCKVFEGAFM